MNTKTSLAPDGAPTRPYNSRASPHLLHQIHPVAGRYFHGGPYRRYGTVQGKSPRSPIHVEGTNRVSFASSGREERRGQCAAEDERFQEVSPTWFRTTIAIAIAAIVLVVVAIGAVVVRSAVVRIGAVMPTGIAA
jgi:hypothetical protein